MKTRQPAMNIPTGEFIREEIECRDWTQQDLARVLGLSDKHVNRIITGADPVSPDVAQKLASAFGQSVEYWMNLEAAYRARLLNVGCPVRDIAVRSEIYSQLPVTEMIKLGWIGGIKERLVEEIKRFLGTESLDFSVLGHAPAMQMRSSRLFASRFNPNHARVWLHKAKLEAKKAPAKGRSSDRAAAERIARQIPEYSAAKGGVKLFIQDLSKAGVRFVCVPHLSKTFLDGAAFEVDGQAVVACTLRHDRVDNFWFVMAHELGHVLQHNQGELPDIYQSTDLKYEDADDRHEAAADAFAFECLGYDELEVFAQSARRFSRAGIVSFARQRNIHPGIVVGFLQHEKRLSSRNLNDLKTKVSPELVAVNPQWIRPEKKKKACRPGRGWRG